MYPARQPSPSKGNNILDTADLGYTEPTMSEKPFTPKTLVEAIRHFSDPDVSLEYVVARRWPQGVTCPYCQSQEVTFMANRRIWNCKGCRKQFSVKVGTIFQDSPIKLDKWLAAIWLIANAKNGISSWELHRTLGVTQKSAWFMLHRIRLAMQTGTFEKLSGHVEIDETFVGGRSFYKHKNKKSGQGRQSDKAVVMGFLEREGRAHAIVTPNTLTDTLHPRVLESVEEGSTVYTDLMPSYRNLREAYTHYVINHESEYVRGEVHTNGLENFWSLLKRGLKGTYISVEPFHLFRYVDEQIFRFNNRKTDDAERFRIAVSAIIGRRLTYRELTGKECAA